MNPIIRAVSDFNDAFFTKYFVIILIFVVLQNLPNNNICNSFLSSSKLFHFLPCVRVLALSSCKQPYDASSKQSDVAWCDGSLTASLRDMSNNKFYFSHKEKKANLFLSKPKGYILYFWNTSKKKRYQPKWLYRSVDFFGQTKRWRRIVLKCQMFFRLLSLLFWQWRNLKRQFTLNHILFIWAFT